VKNIIAIDYGERYIGLALKKNTITSPYAYKVLDSNSIDILDEIKQTLLEHKIDEIVIGYPIGLNAHETRMSNVVDEFIENDLKSIANIPIHKIDERMTSKLTNDNSVRNDDLAALEILNSYLKI
jgi:putative Holliday junction resolvase|tara:strand:- start:182 stop:556 length:375 start_codon:yes stop_codon:yes gene_type:complete